LCNHGDTVSLCVNVPANLSHNGESRWCIKEIDSCIAPIIQALNDGGILTSNSCCGHGNADGEIILQDGRILQIKEPPKEVKYPCTNCRFENSDDKICNNNCGPPAWEGWQAEMSDISTHPMECPCARCHSYEPEDE